MAAAQTVSRVTGWRDTRAATNHLQESLAVLVDGQTQGADVVEAALQVDAVDVDGVGQRRLQPVQAGAQLRRLLFQLPPLGAVATQRLHVELERAPLLDQLCFHDNQQRRSSNQSRLDRSGAIPKASDASDAADEMDATGTTQLVGLT